ncbi:MAG TPA: ATP-binding protein, partial [Bryobacteraceae bacterium]|nr:ATP-binding protein [Bryobacteraceae bacterium]
LQRLIGEDVELRLALGSDLGRVNADPGQIEQVVMNLAVNSRDAMPHGGALTIETSNAEIPENYGSGQMAVAAGSYVALSVMDTGSGMDDETRSRVFEPFFTTKGLGKGTGLGLSTVYSIVKRSGGSLELTSEPGMGTRVTAYLPRIDQPAVLESEKADAITKRGSETILVVEDEEMVRTLVRQTLERAGYRILEAADPSAARRICESYAGPIQLLVSDVVLPKQGGPQLANELLELRPKMKVLFMSGYAEQSAAQGLAKAERAFLPKPFTPAALTRKVREVLEDDGNGLRTRGAGA